VLVDTATGRQADPVLVDRPTGRSLDEADYVFVAGPAASLRTRRHLDFKARVRAKRADVKRRPSKSQP
jgi:hypothetical protein